MKPYRVQMKVHALVKAENKDEARDKMIEIITKDHEEFIMIQFEKVDDILEEMEKEKKVIIC